MPSRSVRAVLTFINGLLSQATAAFVSLVITPLIVATLGAEVFGAWKVIEKTTDFLTLGNFKPLGLLRLTLAKEISKEDFLYKQQQIGSAVNVLLLTLPIMFVLSYLLFYFRETLMPVSKSIQHQTDLALLVNIFVVIMTPFLLVPNTIVKGLNMEYKLLGVSSLANITSALLTYYIVRKGYHLPWIVATSYFAILISAVVNYIIIIRYVPWFKIVRPPKKLVKAFFKLNSWAFLANLFRYVFNSMDLILIGVYFSITTTAVYSLTRTLIIFLLMPANSLMQSGLAGVGDLIGRKELKSVMLLRSEQINALAFVACIVGIVVMFFNASFVSIWVDEKHFGGELLSKLIIISAIIDILAKTEANYIDASLKLKAQALSLGSAAVVYLAIIVLAEPFLGLNVFPIAQIIAQIILIMLYWVGIRDCLQTKISAIAKVVLRPFFIASILFYSCSFFTLHKVDNWFELIVHGAVVGIIMTLLSWMLILQKNDRKRLTTRLLGLLGK